MDVINPHILKKQLNCGFTISSIGMGTYPYKDVLLHSIPYAVNNAGVRLIDTSDNYGNEEFAGEGLKNVDLKEIAIISKFSQPQRTFELEDCFEESKLNLGKINIYLLHWPYPFLWKQQWRKMEDLYISGKCDAIGVCNFDVGYMKELLSICRVKPAINQFERHPLFQQQELVDLCLNNGVAVMAYSPVARMDKTLQESHVLNSIADKYNKTVNQIILRWNIDTNCIPIPASSSEQHIHENFDIFDFSLTRDEVGIINGLEAGKRVRYNPRTRFSLREKLSFLKQRLLLKLHK